VCFDAHGRVARPRAEHYSGAQTHDLERLVVTGSGELTSRGPRPLVDSTRARLLIWALSLGVVLAVFALVYGRSSAAKGAEPTVWATVDAALNLISAGLLVLGYWNIRSRRVRAHRFCMLAAFTASALFLVGYVLHHAQVGSVPYSGTGWLRVAYFGLLVPHIVLAAPVLPLAMFTIYRGYTGRFVAHRKIARVTLPLWLYVSVSGVLVYWMLYYT